MKFHIPLFLILISIMSERLAASDDVAYRYINVESGLSNNSIIDIESDNYGYLWVATNEGLNIVSGNKVGRYFKSEGNIGLPGNELNCLLNDAERSIMWIGTQRSGLVGFNYVSGEKKYFHKNAAPGYGLSGNAVTSFCLDPNHNLWVGTYSNGVNYLDTSTGRVTQYNKDNIAGLGSDNVWSVDYDPAGEMLYVGHEGGGFSEISVTDKKAHTYTTADGLPHNTVRKVLSDGNFVWVCTDNGICRFNKATKEIRCFGSGSYSGRCCDAIKTDNGLLLAYEDYGTLLLDTLSGDFMHIGADIHDNSSAGIPHTIRISKPNRLHRDGFKNIIIGTFNHGLIAISNDTSYFTADSGFFGEQSDWNNQAKANVVTVATLPDNDVWIATSNMGIQHKSGVFKPGGIMTDSRILAMAADKNGSLWICDREGILTDFTPSTGKKTGYDIGIKDYDWIGLDIIGDSIWISSNAGIHIFDKNRRELVGHQDVENNLVRKIARDRYGNFYVGTFGQGLAILDPAMRPVKTLKIDDGFPSNSANDILVDGDTIWIATGEGIVRLVSGDLDNFTVIPRPAKSIYSLIKDRKGNIWFSTVEGIGAVLPGDSVVMFSKELPMRNYIPRSAAIDSMGRIYMGSSDGLLTFMPGFVLDENNLSVPLISALTIDGGSSEERKLIPVSGKEKIVIDHRQNNFTVIISNLDLFRQGDSYEYRMIGLDDKWYPIGDDNQVSFRELPYGKYVFEVRNFKGSGKETLSSLEIVILPPLWLRWWAILIYVVLACILGAFIIRHYIKRLNSKAEEALRSNKEKQEQENREERVRFFTNVTHELRTPLTLINGPLEDLLKGDSLNSDDRWKVDVIHKNAQRLLSLVNQLLDYRKTETNNKRLCVRYGNIVPAVKEIAMKYVELNRNPNVAISVSASSDDVQVYFDKEVITIILDNLISNAMKYTETGMISISVDPDHREDGSWVKICVRDTGHGIGQEALPHIFDSYYQENSEHQASGTGIGLALVKALVELHHGEISVESAKDVGSCFCVLLRRDNDYPEAIHIEQSVANEENGDKAGESVSTTEVADASDSEGNRDNIEVLVVEDNPDILEYIRQSLSGIFSVKTASNGRDGLEIALRDVPDVVVTDIMMPIMDGIQMTKQLKGNIATSHVPVVMLTAKSSTADRQEGYDVGVDSYITKPFNASLLISRINNIVSRRHMLTEYIKSLTEKSVTSNPTDAADSPEQESKRLNESLGKLDREFLEKLDHFILNCENTDKVNLDYLTDVLCMSRPTLYRKIKAVTGMSSNEYIRNVRMRRAKELLLSGRHNIAEVSEILGFSSPGYFRETFKSMFGKTPSEYLKSLRQQ